LNQFSLIFTERGRERLRSIGLSTSVCVCLYLCLSACEDISGTTRAIFTKFMHVAYGRGSVLLRCRCVT